MARLKIVRASGETIVSITPVVEVAFEKFAGQGIYKQLREFERNSDLYWLAHNALQRIEVTAPYDDFLKDLISVDVIEDDEKKA
tara:strand:+ start:2536 stop:2787 length:252 start_codon:yes stop_codon:yes gene_type:complete